MAEEKIDGIASALVKAQKQIQAAHKDGKNPHFKSKYATIEAVWDACRDALNSSGLAVTQTVEVGEYGPLLKTTLLHVGGQIITSECPLLNPKGDMQGLGSAITYARRYSLAALVGVVQEDDDGQSATTKAYDHPASPNQHISEAQGKRLYAIATGELKRTKEWYLTFVEGWGVERPSDILKSEYEQFEQDMRNAAA